MFRKILIANRGEIACRVIRTARRMGIKTVAVYSDADKDSRHVEMADEAVAIGPPPSAQSYLVIERIVAACKATGAEAVHPGYGFLSENPAFCTALENEGIVFIGPKAQPWRRWATRSHRRNLRSLEGQHDSRPQRRSHRRGTAPRQGYRHPVMISSAGGAARVCVSSTMTSSAARVSPPARPSEERFHDDRVFIEKFVQDPSHIEIRCSVSLRQHYVPTSAVFDQDATRRSSRGAFALLDDATRVRWASAGAARPAVIHATVEFVVATGRSLSEMKPGCGRHPVTEAITGSIWSG
jgi:propionyl-CoA carboxylase alpha chain